MKNVLQKAILGFDWLIFSLLNDACQVLDKD